MPNLMPKRFSFAPGWWLAGHDQASYLQPGSQLYQVAPQVEAFKIWAPMTGVGLSSTPAFTGIYEQYSAKFQYPIAFFNNVCRGKAIESELALPSPKQLPQFAGTYITTNDQIQNFAIGVADWIYNTYYANWIAQGGRIDCISFDGPVNKLVGNGFVSAADAINCLLLIMVRLRLWMPGVRFIYLENLPIMPFSGYPGINTPYGDQTVLYADMLARARNMGVGFSRVEIDCPYNYVVQTGQLNKLVAFIKLTRNIVPDISLIINSGDTVIDPANPPRAYNAPVEQKFTRDVASYMNLLKFDNRFAAAMPSRLCMQTWTTAPFSLGMLTANFNYMKALS